MSFNTSKETLLKTQFKVLPDLSSNEVSNPIDLQAADSLDQSSVMLPGTYHYISSLSGENTCALNDPNLPLVCEIEHTINKCFCYLCTCGKHICPGDYRTRHAGLKLSMSSTYKKNFNRRIKNLIPLDPEQLDRLRTRNGVRGSPRMDLITIKQQDFVKFDGVDIPKASLYSQALTTYDIPFLGRSNYQADFPNWGPTGVPRARHASLPYRGDEIRMDIGTTYANQYKRHEIARGEKDLKKRFGSSLKLSFVSPISTDTHFFSETTSHVDYKAHKNLLPTQTTKHSSSYSPVIHSPRHFNTLYRESYHISQGAKHLPTKKELSKRIHLDLKV